MITHIERHDQDSLGLLAISQNVKLNDMGQQESQGALCFFADDSSRYYHDRVKLPYLWNWGMVPRGPSYPTFTDEVVGRKEGKIVLPSMGS